MRPAREGGGCGWRIAVVIPAMNEEDGIEPCVASVLQAGRACPRVGEIHVTVVADSCTDRTAARARAALGTCGAVLECAVGSPGTARRLGVRAALKHYSGADPAQLWLANTDADTVVPADWLERQLQFADAGITAVAGIVGILAAGGDSGALSRLLLASDYEIAADGSHGHVHGANLGVRADAYLDAGGWSHRRVAEDHCLWHRLRHRGWPTAASASSIVHTSGRLHGRASGGFADTLRGRLERQRA
jgi:cellulose synthase/poly-beta-1,6-N-acetylglucosamine synthase-like glycosyltransferase